MIKDEEVESAVDYLRDNAKTIAAARAEFAYVEEFRKVVKATIMREHADEALGAQEALAYSDARYKQHLSAIKEAAQQYEFIRWRMTAAETKISAWQTQQRATRGGI